MSTYSVSDKCSHNAEFVLALVAESIEADQNEEQAGFILKGLRLHQYCQFLTFLCSNCMLPQNYHFSTVRSACLDVPDTHVLPGCRLEDLTELHEDLTDEVPAIVLPAIPVCFLWNCQLVSQDCFTFRRAIR